MNSTSLLTHKAHWFGTPVSSRRDDFRKQISKLLPFTMISRNEKTVTRMTTLVQTRISDTTHFTAFGLNTNIYSENLRIQSKYGKTRTRKKLLTLTLFVQ